MNYQYAKLNGSKGNAGMGGIGSKTEPKPCNHGLPRLREIANDNKDTFSFTSKTTSVRQA